MLKKIEKEKTEKLTLKYSLNESKFVREFLAEKLLYLSQFKLTRFISRYFNDVLKSLGREEIEINGTVQYQT